MQNILHVTFANSEDGIHAAESLLAHGAHVEDINLILARRQCNGSIHTVVPTASLPLEETDSPGDGSREAIIGFVQGTWLGVGLGLLVAMCIPGIGLIAGSGALIADLMAGGALAGGISGGIYGYLTDRGVGRESARAMSNHLEAGGTNLSVSVSDALSKAEIIKIIERFGGYLIQPEIYKKEKEQ